MEIATSDLNNTVKITKTPAVNQTEEPEVKFADELNSLKQAEQVMPENTDSTDEESENAESAFDANLETLPEGNDLKFNNPEDEIINTEHNAKNRTVEVAIDELSNIISTLNQSEDNEAQVPKDNKMSVDNTNKTEIDTGIIFNKLEPKYETDRNTDTTPQKIIEEGTDMINNDYNIDSKDKLPPMMPNMNFGGDGQPFSSFMNDNANDKNHKEITLSSSAKELEEEAEILSTMAENVAIAKVNMDAEAIASPVEKTVLKEDGIKKIDTNTNIVKEVIVKYDNIVMNEADVQVFADLVGGKEVNMNDISPDNIQKSVHVSKTLADMLAKAMEDNRPVRIEFDNGISVIIKISRDGKLSADFLPSTQIAEAYLRENLPILKQKLSDQNIDYDELNQRERRNREQEQNRKKGREDE